MYVYVGLQVAPACALSCDGPHADGEQAMNIFMQHTQTHHTST